MFKIVRVERQKKATAMPQLGNLLLGFAALSTAILIAVVATYPEFFLFNPFDSGDWVRSVCLTLTSLGWLTLAVGPLVILALNASGKDSAIRFLPWVALAWPAALVINHVALLIQTHKLYVGYLAVYPIFIITDICLPLAYLAVASYVKRTRSFSSVGLSHGKHQEEERS